MGLNTDKQEILVHRYISFTDTEKELYAPLIAKVVLFTFPKPNFKVTLTIRSC